MTFKFKCLTQGQLGSLFGVSSHVIGKWLTAVGLRDEQTKKPTREAHRQGFCDTAPSGASGYHWVWQAEKTVTALRNAGHKLVEELPFDLVQPPDLAGPFIASQRTIANAEGMVVVKAATAQQANIVARLLNAAERHGTLQKLLSPAEATSYIWEQHDTPTNQQPSFPPSTQQQSSSASDQSSSPATKDQPTPTNPQPSPTTQQPSPTNQQPSSPTTTQPSPPTSQQSTLETDQASSTNETSPPTKSLSSSQLVVSEPEAVAR